MPKFNWLNDPKYQRQIQKLMRATPDQKAIINTVIADEQFADADMRKNLTLANMAAEKLSHEREHELGSNWLDFRKKEFATGQELTESGRDIRAGELDFMEDQADLAELLGYGNILVSGIGGVTDLKRKKREADYLSRKAGLYK